MPPAPCQKQTPLRDRTMPTYDVDPSQTIFDTWSEVLSGDNGSRALIDQAPMGFSIMSVDWEQSFMNTLTHCVGLEHIFFGKWETVIAYICFLGIGILFWLFNLDNFGFCFKASRNSCKIFNKKDFPQSSTCWKGEDRREAQRRLRTRASMRAQSSSSLWCRGQTC